jgi:hypothetical protein
MNHKILIVGALACLSAVAVAQADKSTDKTKDQAPAAGQVVSPRDIATGQASGKRMHKPITVTTDDSTTKVTPTATSGKPMASDDWHAAAAKSSDPKSASSDPARVATGDVNGDGVAENAKNSGHATEQKTASDTSSAGVTAPRDLATGHASGKRQHEPPVTTTKETDTKSKQQ